MRHGTRIAISIISMWMVACGGESSGDEDIIDIGKTCAAASDCDHVCTGAAGAASGQCSIACTSNADCPSFMDCVTSSSTGEQRCFDPGGLVVKTELAACSDACRDVAYFCTSGEIGEAETRACRDWCTDAADPDREAMFDCVESVSRYTSACPAAECVLERIR